MLDKAAIKLTDRLMKKGIIKEQDYELYHFGIETAILKLLHLVAYAAMGLLLQEVIQLLVFLVTFIPLREYSGGYHASSRRRCFIISCLTVLFMLLTVRLLPAAYGLSIYIAAFSGTGLLFLVPVESAAKPIDDSEKIYYKSKAGFIIVLLLTAVLFLYMIGQPQYSFVIALGLFCEVTAVIAGKLAAAIYGAGKQKET